MAEVFKIVSIDDDMMHLSSSGVASEPLDVIDSVKIDADVLHERMEQVRKEAFESGFNQGLSAGLTQANTQMTDQITAIAALLQSIPEAINTNRLQLSTEIADIVLVIAQQFFINQQQNKETIGLQITQTIAQLNDKQNIELSLHPQDLTLLQQGLVTIDLQQCKNLRITPDENLRLGGCIIRSAHGVFDAGIERQIDSLKHVLLQIKQGEWRG